MKINFDDLEQRLNYKFKKDLSLLEQALTHSSYANEKSYDVKDYERLEFLGDAILEFIVSDYLINAEPDQKEGELTKRRAYLVCEKSLSSFAKEINLGNFLRLSPGELKNNGNERESILSDVFEAVIAAIYIDGGLDCAKSFVLPYIKKAIQSEDYKTYSNDCKTELQEVLQRKYNGNIDLKYIVNRQEGPDNEKVFHVSAILDGKIIGRGSGTSKKRAEQKAAEWALKHLDIDFEAIPGTKE